MSEAVAPNEARLLVRSGPLVGAVLGRVVGMLAARALCPIDRLDDALLVSDAIAAHAPDHTTDGQVAVTVSTDASSILLAVGLLRPRGAAGLLADATLPGIGNVLEHMADEITTRPAGSGEELLIRIAFANGARKRP